MNLWIDDHLLPGPENPPRDTNECWHPAGAGRRVEEGTIRCGACGAPLGMVSRKTRCSCQLAGAYATECLLTGRCSEGVKA